MTISFDREALIAAGFPDITRQQQGETASMSLSAPVSRVQSPILNRYLTKTTTADSSSTFCPELKLLRTQPLKQKTCQQNTGLNHSVKQTVTQFISALILGLTVSARVSSR